MRIGLSSFVFYNYPLEEAIRETAAAGFDGIDIWGGRPHAYRQDLEPGECDSLAQLLSDAELSVASFIPAQFRYPTSLCSPIATIWKDSGDYIRESTSTARALGARIVSVCPGHSLHGQGKEDAWMRLCANLDGICDFASSRDMKVALEPADRYETDLVQSTEQAIRLLGELRWSNLGVVLDVGHCQLVGETPAESIRLLGSALLHVHVDDNAGQRDQHLVPGDGIIDFGSVLSSLEEIGYEGFVSAELGWDYTTDPVPAIRRTIAYLRGLIGND